VKRVLYRSGEARADLWEIWDVISVRSVRAADRQLRLIGEAEQRLLEFAEMGAARPDIRPGLRHWPVGKYLIFYRVTDERVEVVRVVHGARDLGVLFDD
jgi:toxin ParE1/3/4